MRTWILLFIIYFVVACAPKELIRKTTDTIGYRELLQYNEKWQASLQSLDGTANITLDTPEYSGKFNADVLLQGSDSLLLTVTGPLGLRVGKVFATGERFVFYNQIMNQFMVGVEQDFEDMNFMQFPLELSRLRNVFTAQDRFGILKKEIYEMRDGALYVETENGTLRYHIWFDPNHLHITKIEYYDGNQLLFYKEYERFETYNGVVFPRMIHFIRPMEKQGLSVYFSKLDINQPLSEERFKIQVSDKAKQIDLSLEQ